MRCLLRIRRLSKLIAPALLLVVAGCFSRGYSRDTMTSRRSAAILESYSDEPRDPNRLNGLPASLNRAYGYEAGKKPRPVTGRVLPAYRAPDVELPGSPKRAWEGPPRTRPYYPLALRPPAPAVVQPLPDPGARSGTGTPSVPGKVDKDVLRAGDIIKVTVSGHPEFSGEWFVDDRGFLSIPDGGAFGVNKFTGESFSEDIGRVSSMKVFDLEAEIARKLKVYVRKAPQVTVDITGRQGG